MVAQGDILRLIPHIYAVQQGIQQAGLMTLHYRVASIAGQWTLANVAELSSVNPFQQTLPLALCNHATFYGCECRAESGADVLQVGYGKPLNPVPGARPGSLLPAQVAAILKKTTLRVGRAFRGRAYFPFLSATDLQADGEMSATLAGILSATITVPLFSMVLTKNAGADTLTLQGCLWHRKTSTFDDLKAVVSVAKFGTQRRRGVYGRGNAIPPDLAP